MMKNLNLRILLALAVFSLLFVSCKKDDETIDVPKANAITYNGQEYGLVQGYINPNLIIYKKAAPVEGFVYQLFFVSSTIDVDDYGYRSGTGDCLIFIIYSSLETGLAAGTYYYDASNSGAAGTFNSGWLLLDWNFTLSKLVAAEIQISGGKITVVNTGAGYGITYEGVLETGEQFTAYYKGTLIETQLPQVK